MGKGHLNFIKLNALVLKRSLKFSLSRQYVAVHAHNQWTTRAVRSRYNWH